MNSKKMTSVATAIVCGFWLLLAGIVIPANAGYDDALGSPLLIMDLEEQLLNELYEYIENGEFVEEDLLDDFDSGQVDTLMYELSEEDIPIMELFIKSTPENGYILLTPFRMPDRIHECIRI